jgi:glycosyltransferase involved in cell wall biosynthesis
VILAIIIPVYNEAHLLPRLMERVLSAPAPMIPIMTDSAKGQQGGLPMQRRIYIVDDASTDGTRQEALAFAERPELKDTVRVLTHERNMGKGAAVRTGFRVATSEACDVLLIQDGDLEYDPRDHQQLVAPILDGRADAVIGTRFGGQAHRVLYFWHYLANRAITLFSNALTNLNLSDIECCLKAMRLEVAQQITIREDRFGIEPELVAKLARASVHAEGRAMRARVYEVAVSYAGRTYAEGKKIGWRDGVSALRCIVKYNLLG